MTAEEQLKLWVAGKPVHNKTRDECTPDFSCCVPECMAPQEERDAFAKAEAEGDESTRMSMLGTFLGRCIANHQKKKGTNKTINIIGAS